MKPGMVLFRSDASITIGSGHVMRCLSLPRHLGQGGVESAFLSRKHPGNLNDFVRTKGSGSTNCRLIKAGLTILISNTPAGWERPGPKTLSRLLR